jgi:hypothetical protein
MSITITGIPSGDCECFCWEVTLEEYEKVTGGKPDDEWEKLQNGLYRLYPDDIMRKLLGDNYEGKISTVTFSTCEPCRTG